MNINRWPSRYRRITSLAVLALLMSGVIFWCLGPMVLHPNDYFFEAGGDGIRNYYSVAYYVAYDSGLHFSGMNYPYGEHVLYTDNQFPLAWLLSLIQQHFFDIAPYTVAIINYMMMLSLFLSAIIIYLLLEKLLVKDWFAVPAAIAITILSPQIQRMTGHYSLAYVFFTPLLLYLVFRLIHSSAKIKWTILIIFMIIFFGLTHLYYLAMAGAFILSFGFTWMVYEWLVFRKVSNRVLFLLATVLVPLMFIEGLLFLTDSANDRIPIPHGFFESYASYESVFKAPVWSYLNHLEIHKLVSLTQQGYAYIGLVADLAFVIAGLLLLLWLVRRTVFKRLIPVVNPFVVVAAIAAVPVLIFAMCLPWRWYPEWLDHFSMIRQFRALDRFAYVFYYVISVFAACLFFTLIDALFQRRFVIGGILISTILFSLWIADGWSNISVIKKAYPFSNYAREYFSEDNFTKWLSENGFTPNDFQAILPLPFYHIGSEKIWIDHPISLYVSSWASLNTGLPVLSSYLGRTSISQTLGLTQLMADTVIEKELLQKLPGKKPLLVITSNEQLTTFEQWLLRKATFIKEHGPYRMYVLPLTAFNVSLTSIQSTFTNRHQLLVPGYGNIFTTNSSTPVISRYYSHTDTFFTEEVISDTGSLILFDETLPALTDSMEYEVSVWVKLHMNNYASPDMHLNLFNNKGEMIRQLYVQTKSAANVLHGWSRIHIPVMLTGNYNRMKVVLLCDDERISACRFMIRPVATDVYYPLGSSGAFVFNNFPIGWK